MLSHWVLIKFSSLRIKCVSWRKYILHFWAFRILKTSLLLFISPRPWQLTVSIFNWLQLSIIKKMVYLVICSNHEVQIWLKKKRKCRKKSTKHWKQYNRMKKNYAGSHKCFGHWQIWQVHPEKLICQLQIDINNIKKYTYI